MISFSVSNMYHPYEYQYCSINDLIGTSNHNHGNGNNFGCDCMEYWTCILGGGTPYSYCGIHAHDVCCFVPVNAEPVGILPTPSHSRCGKKGQDSGANKRKTNPLEVGLLKQIESVQDHNFVDFLKTNWPENDITNKQSRSIFFA